MQINLDKLSKETGITKKDLLKIYKYYWLFIREHIENLPLKEISEEEFSHFRTNFNLMGLGKLVCTKEHWKQLKDRKHDT